jgi:hypothetical protein
MDRLTGLANNSLNDLKLFQPVAFKPSSACTSIGTRRLYATWTVRKVSDSRRDRVSY